MFFNVKNLVVGLLLLVSKTCSQNSFQTNKEGANVALELNGAIPDEMYPSKKIVISTHTDFAKKHYLEKISEFKKNPLEKNDIVFLGKSITEKGGDWAKRLNNPKIKIEILLEIHPMVY